MPKAAKGKKRKGSDSEDGSAPPSPESPASMSSTSDYVPPDSPEPDADQNPRLRGSRTKSDEGSPVAPTKASAPARQLPPTNQQGNARPPPSKQQQMHPQVQAQMRAQLIAAQQQQQAMLLHMNAQAQQFGGQRPAALNPAHNPQIANLQHLQNMQNAQHQSMPPPMLQSAMVKPPPPTQAMNPRMTRNSLLKLKISQVLGISTQILLLWNDLHSRSALPAGDELTAAFSERLQSNLLYMQHVENHLKDMTVSLNRQCTILRTQRNPPPPKPLLEFPADLRPDLTGALYPAYQQLKRYFDAADEHERELQNRSMASAQLGKPTPPALMQPPRRPSGGNHQQTPSESQTPAQITAQIQSPVSASPATLPREPEAPGSRRQSITRSKREQSESQDAPPHEVSAPKRQRVQSNASPGQSRASLPPTLQQENNSFSSASQAMQPQRSNPTASQNTNTPIQRPPSAASSIHSRQMSQPPPLQPNPNFHPSLAPYIGQVTSLQQTCNALQSALANPNAPQIPPAQRQQMHMQLQMTQKNLQAAIEGLQGQQALIHRSQQAQRQNSQYLQGANLTPRPNQNPFSLNSAQPMPGPAQSQPQPHWENVSAGSPPYSIASPAMSNHASPVMPNRAPTPSSMQSSLAQPAYPTRMSSLPNAPPNIFQQTQQFQNAGNPSQGQGNGMNPAQQAMIQRMGANASVMANYNAGFSQPLQNPAQASPGLYSNQPQFSTNGQPSQYPSSGQPPQFTNSGQTPQFSQPVKSHTMPPGPPAPNMPQITPQQLQNMRFGSLGGAATPPANFPPQIEETMPAPAPPSSDINWEDFISA